MKKEKNGTLHWLELNVTQSPWVVEQCPECGSEVWLKRDEKTGKWTHERRNEMTKPEEMVMKTVHDLGTAIDSDVCNYTGLLVYDATAAFDSLEKKKIHQDCRT